MVAAARNVCFNSFSKTNRKISERVYVKGFCKSVWILFFFSLLAVIEAHLYRILYIERLLRM